MPSNKWVWLAVGIALGVFAVPKVRAITGV